MAGKLIVVDGLDGSGKTTQQRLVAHRLRENKIPVKEISFPDYGSPSSALITQYLQGDFGKNPGDVNPYAASSFYAVDRYASFRLHWAKDYQEGSFILAARYTSSNLFHQMVKLPFSQWDSFINWIEDYEFDKLQIPKPDQVFFLDMPPEVSKKLISLRYQGDETRRDIHERDFSYLSRCREAALYACQKLHYEVIPCFKGEVVRRVEEITDELFEKMQKEWKA